MEDSKYYVHSIIRYPEAREHFIKQADYKLAEALVQKLKEANGQAILVRLEAEIVPEYTEFGVFDVYKARLHFDIPKIEMPNYFAIPPKLKWYEKAWRKLREIL